MKDRLVCLFQKPTVQGWMHCSVLEKPVEPSWKKGSRRMGHRYRKKLQMEWHTLQNLTKGILAHGGKQVRTDSLHEGLSSVPVNINCTDSTKPQKNYCSSDIKQLLINLTWYSNIYFQHHLPHNLSLIYLKVINYSSFIMTKFVPVLRF